MKVTMEFNLPDERWLYDIHCKKAYQYYECWDAVRDFLRTAFKHRDLTSEQYQILEELEATFNEHCPGWPEE